MARAILNPRWKFVYEVLKVSIPSGILCKNSTNADNKPTLYNVFSFFLSTTLSIILKSLSATIKMIKKIIIPSIATLAFNFFKDSGIKSNKLMQSITAREKLSENEINEYLFFGLTYIPKKPIKVDKPAKDDSNNDV